jgi:hypothetical protein
MYQGDLKFMDGRSEREATNIETNRNNKKT